MGLTLQGLGAIGEGAVSGFQSQRKDNRAQAAEGRTAESHEFQKVYNEILAGRGRVDAPQPAPIAAIPQAGAAIPEAGAGPAAGGQPPPAAGGQPPPAEALPLGGEGTMESPMELSTMNVTGDVGGGAGGGAGGGGARPPQGPTRRERYKKWYDEAYAAAARAGGIEGLQLFIDKENATSRQQMMGYAREAVTAIKNGMVGESVKLMNTALEVSPFDTGMEFIANDGKMYLMGPDGNMGEPYGQAELMAMIRDRLGTPENYLNMEEGARKNEQQRIDEEDKDLDRELVERDVEVKEDKAPSEILVNKATAYYRLAAGKGALDTDGGGEGDPSTWWGKPNASKIEEIETRIKNGEMSGFPLSSPWIKEDFGNTELFSSTMAGLKSIRSMNNPLPSATNPRALTDNDAGELARMAYFNELNLNDVDISTVTPPGLSSIKVLYDDTTGAWKVGYKGGTYLIPPEIGERIQKNRGLLPAG